MKESKIPGIIENSVVARVLPLKSTLFPPSNPNEIRTAKSEFLDNDVRSLIGEVYEG